MFASAVTAGAQADSAVTNLNSAATNLDSHSGGQPPPDAQYMASHETKFARRIEFCLAAGKQCGHNHEVSKIIRRSCIVHAHKSSWQLTVHFVFPPIIP